MLVGPQHGKAARESRLGACEGHGAGRPTIKQTHITRRGPRLLVGPAADLIHGFYFPRHDVAFPQFATFPHLSRPEDSRHQDIQDMKPHVLACVRCAGACYALAHRAWGTRGAAVGHEDGDVAPAREGVRRAAPALTLSPRPLLRLKAGEDPGRAPNSATTPIEHHSRTNYKRQQRRQQQQQQQYPLQSGQTDHSVRAQLACCAPPPKRMYASTISTSGSGGHRQLCHVVPQGSHLHGICGNRTMATQGTRRYHLGTPSQVAQQQKRISSDDQVEGTHQPSHPGTAEAPNTCH